MSEATLLESRLSKVEQDNRRLKLTVGALLLALAAVAVMSQRIPDVIQARAFEVIDENETGRVMLNADGIGYHDENGNPRALLTDTGISYGDENGNTFGVRPAPPTAPVGEGSPSNNLSPT